MLRQNFTKMMLLVTWLVRMS